jgi:hypothetical protein
MNFLPKRGFEVLHPAVSQLIVVAHPDYLFLLIPLALVTFGVYFGVNGIRKNDSSNIGLGLFLLAVGIVVGSGVASHGRAVFDKGTATVTFNRVGFLFRPSQASFPLDQVRYASVESSSGSYRFIVVFKGGGLEGLTASSGAPGQYKAADAVNEFLGVFPATGRP